MKRPLLGMTAAMGVWHFFWVSLSSFGERSAWGWLALIAKPK
jgi:hypothetical protein